MFAPKAHCCFTPDSIRDWLGQRRDDPSAMIVEEAAAWCAELPMHDAYAALDSISAMLDALSSAKSLPLSNRAALARVFDSAASPFVAKLYADYLKTLHGHAEKESRLWLVLTGYWFSVEQTYVGLAKEIHACRQNVVIVYTVLIERAITALSEQAKLARMRYCAADTRIWQALGRLFLMAETAETCVLPDGVIQAWARLFMREMASPQNLLPHEIEIVDRLAMHYSAQFVCQRGATTEAGYFFDLLAGQAPTRRIPTGQSSANSLFFGAGKSYQQAGKDALSIEQRGSLYALPALAGFAPEEVGRMLHHVARHWSPSPPAREQDRSEVLSRVMIVFDVNEIRRNIAKGDSKGMDSASAIAQPDLVDAAPAAAVALTESWVVRDESSGGFGADVPSPMGDGLCVGKLLGYKREGGDGWGLGVIRRVERDTCKPSRVGIQILSEQPRTVRLRPIGAAQLSAWNKRDEAPDNAYCNGILLSLPQGQENGVLLLPCGTYAQEAYFEWIYDAARDLIAITRLAIHTEEFDLLRYRLV